MRANPGGLTVAVAGRLGLEYLFRPCWDDALRGNMNRLRMGLLGLSSLVVIPIAWACSTCARDIADPAEYDKRSWDAASTVFVARVTKAEAHDVGGSSVEITYTVEPEEVFKGQPSAVKRVYSQRTVNGWQASMRIIDCGYVSVAPGDRLLIFATTDAEVMLGECSQSQLIEGKGVARPERIAGSLKRLRSWRDSR